MLFTLFSGKSVSFHETIEFCMHSISDTLKKNILYQFSLDNILQIASDRFISIPNTLKTNVLQHSPLKSAVYMLNYPFIFPTFSLNSVNQ
jgi:hypothetical protein